MAKLQTPLPDHVHEASRRALAKRHAETLARIDDRIAAYVALQKEKALALAWCRANGNPHMEADNA
jgi:hypothetical protein